MHWSQDAKQCSDDVTDPSVWTSKAPQEHLAAQDGIPDSKVKAQH
jgi:hypothetical protein